VCVERVLDPLGIVDAGHLHKDLVSALTALALNRGLGDSKRIDASLDDGLCHVGGAITLLVLRGFVHRCDYGFPVFVHRPARTEVALELGDDVRVLCAVGRGHDDSPDSVVAHLFKWKILLLSLFFALSTFCCVIFLMTSSVCT